MLITKTHRLNLRELTIQDAVFAYELNLDPDVIRYTGDAPFQSIDDAANFLQNYDHYKKYGFGRWGVEDKSSGKLLGWCGIKYTPELDEVDLGFRFFKKYWGRGYATEAGKACIDLAFDTFNIEVLIGRAMKENKASIRVLQKLGMEFLKESPCADQPGLVLQLRKSMRNAFQ